MHARPILTVALCSTLFLVAMARFGSGSKTVFGGRSGASTFASESSDAALYLPVLNMLPNNASQRPIPVEPLEESSTAVRLAGPWERVLDDRASGGAYVVSRTPGASAEIEFDGDSITLLRLVDVAGGRAAVTVDGAALGELSFAFVESRWQVPAVIDHIGTGAHRLRLKVLSDQPVFLDAFVMPNPYPPTADQLAALARLNEHRTHIGLSSARLISAASLAAQAHAEFDAEHHEGHGETPGKSGFTGASPSERVSMFGVERWCSEVMVGIGGFDGQYFEPERSIEEWLGSVFHRSALLRYGVPSIGYGHGRHGEGATSAEVVVVDICEHIGPPPASRLIYTFPSDGQTEVPLSFNSDTEGPDPLPEHSGDGGYPISLYIAQPAEVLADGAARSLLHAPAPGSPQGGSRSDTTRSASIVELRGPDDRLIPAHVLDWTDEVFILAEQPLRMSRRYSVRIAGSDSRGVPFDHRWSFTTMMATRIEGVSVSAGACGAEARWRTAGTTRSWLDYGPTDAYGTRLVGSESGTSHTVRLEGLQPQTPYHFRISAADDSGNVTATADDTFTTPPPRTLRVPEEFGTIGAALEATEICETVRVAAGTYREKLAVRPGVHLVGAGPGRSVVRGDGSGSVVSLGDGAEIRGFTITGSGTEFWDAGIFISESASPIIRNNHLHGNSMAIAMYCFNPPCTSSPVITNNILQGQSTCGVCWNVGAPLIVNNTIVDSRTGIGDAASAMLVKNNIIAGNASTGIDGHSAPETVRYNNLWNNGRDYGSGTPGPGSLMVDPRFIAPTLGDFHLRADSPCRGAGDPDAAYDNPGGSRNDMGAYGGPGAEE